MKNPLIIIDPRDNVATALRDLHKGEDIEIPDMGILLSMIEEIPFGHKVSLQEIGKGGMIMKYGEIIGQATSDIPKGSHVHVHNIESLRGRGDLEGDLS